MQTVQGGGVRKISRRTFHALLHSFTSALANANVAPELRMKLTGHTTEAIHRGYTHHGIGNTAERGGKTPLTQMTVARRKKQGLKKKQFRTCVNSLDVVY